MAAEFAGKRALSELLSEILKKKSAQSEPRRRASKAFVREKTWLTSGSSTLFATIDFVTIAASRPHRQPNRSTAICQDGFRTAGAKPIEQFFSMTACRCPEWKIYHFQLVQCSEPNNTSRLSEYAVGLTSGRCHDIRHSRMQRRTERCHHAHQPRGCCR